jgi:hypothetical protein
VEWLEKAVKQNNPGAMSLMGVWFRSVHGNDKKRAISLDRTAAELGWRISYNILGMMLKKGHGCAKDLGQAAIWYAKGDSESFWQILTEAGRTVGQLDEDLYYSLGWGLYWYKYGTQEWINLKKARAFANRCLDYYCSCVELQQKSIFTFLLWCWNQTTGVKGPGQMIAQMVWEQREVNLVKTFDQNNGGEEPGMK